MAETAGRPRTVGRWLEAFERASASKRLSLLDELSPELAQGAAPTARNLLSDERNPSVRAALIRTFGKHWDFDFLDHLGTTIPDAANSVRLAIFEVLSVHAPRSLLPELPRFMLHRDPHLRILAIRSLAAVDPPAAVEHLEFMLRTGENSQRRKALEEVIHFPWNLAKPVLLRFLALESDPFLLEAAAIHFQINPDQASPRQLIDLMLESPPQKKAILDTLVNRICEALKEGVLPPAEFDRFLGELRRWVKIRGAVRFASFLVERLRNADPQTVSAMEPAILQRLKDPHLREQVSEALKKPIPETVRALLRRLLDRASPNAGEGPSEPRAQKVSTGEGTDEALARGILTMGEAEYRDGIHRFEATLADRHASPVVKSAVLRRALQLEIADFTRFAERWADQADSPALEIASLEYLEAFDKAYDFPVLFHLIEKILLSEAIPAKKVGAIRILKKRNPREALDLALHMLASRKRDQQETALSCLVFFDFPLYRSQLERFLASSPDQDLFDAGLCLFETNPDPENLFSLFGLRKRISGKAGKEVWRVMEATDNALREGSAAPSAISPDGLRKMEERFAFEESFSRRVPPPYALAGLHPKNPRGAPTSEKGFFRRLLSRIGLGD